ncbi:MAG TPA: SUMF1/EgtB/PvdO family nonheme iron enzyme [Polyangiaceae bacterium]|nr:SUMF1/EgtB/PvdO family nonheme iron enzyme [Polyangiaceae bacterium]
MLDIEDPKLRPTPSGGNAGEASTPEGGEGGAPTLGGSSNTMVLAGGGAGGEAGSPTPPECTDAQVQCGGTDAKTPQICQDGHWVANTDEANGDCQVLCDAGKCLECQGDERRCTVCPEDATDCSTNQPQHCVKGFWKDDGPECAQFCQVGECVTTPSCAAMHTGRTTCGEESCCRSLMVPGGSFKRNYDGGLYPDGSHSGEVTNYYLDKYEVSVGRMRAFVDAYPTKPKAGAGRSNHIPDDAGWDADVPLPIDRDALLTELRCDGATWSDDLLDPHDDQPINCVSYYVAYAFCIWDEGRLPSDLEWNFAASGGSEQRVYPWKKPESGPAITPEYATYTDGNVRPLGPSPVGSTPKGNSRWGQADMAGNVFEWALDYFGDDPPTCKDCLNTTSAIERVVRGGAYTVDANALKSALRTSLEPQYPRSKVGFRCARDVQ